MVNIKASKGLLLLMIICAACLGATGQLLFKFGVKSGISFVYLLPGIAAYAISTAIYFVVLSRSHLSWTYGLNGVSYVLTVLLALVFLHETIPVLRWAGVAVIAIGAALVGFS
ncbi:MAG: hypothetical protein KGH94_00335 [Candidatus Micrarchaeota archaeon]|nr:hypothetical protein [Candidatus Micrarchaeota archaeon]